MEKQLVAILVHFKLSKQCILNYAQRVSNMPSITKIQKMFLFRFSSYKFKKEEEKNYLTNGKIHVVIHDKTKDAHN